MNRHILSILLALTCATTFTQCEMITSLHELTLESTPPASNCNNHMANKLAKTPGFSELLSKTVIEDSHTQICTDEFKLNGSCCKNSELVKFVTQKTKAW